MLNVLIELLVCPCSFCSIEIAAANDMAISGIKVEGISDIIDLAERKVLLIAKVNIYNTMRGEVFLCYPRREGKGLWVLFRDLPSW